DSEAFKQQVAAKEAQRKQPSNNGYALVFVLIWIGLAIFIVLRVARAQRGGRGSGGAPWFVPVPTASSSWGPSSSGSSWSSGGSSDGGGFSGGGGDFGGGGSSGSW